MPQELSYKHPDGWVITTQNFSEGQTDTNTPTKTEPSGWVNTPNIEPYQGLVKVEQLDVNSLSAITANMGSITSGTITMDADGYIKGGQTAYNTGTGFFLGYDGSAYKFSIGGATNNLKWDGTDLIINGSTVNAVNFELNGTGVTATANELNRLANDTLQELGISSNRLYYRYILTSSDMSGTGATLRVGGVTVENGAAIAFYSANAIDIEGGEGTAPTYDTNNIIAVELYAKHSANPAVNAFQGFGFSATGDFATDDDVVDTANGSTPSCMFCINSSGELYAKTSNSSGAAGVTVTQITGITLTNRNLYKIIFNGLTDTAYFYVNDILKATHTGAGNDVPSSGSFTFGVVAGANKRISITCPVITITL